MSIFPKRLPLDNPAAAQPFQWLMRPQAGWALLQIGKTVYAVHECHFDDDNGRTCFCVKLQKQGGEDFYQICQDRDNELRCTCADATYRDRQCKHCLAIIDAYADLNREERLDDFLGGIRDVLDESDAVSALALDFDAVDRLVEVADRAVRAELAKIAEGRVAWNQPHAETLRRWQKWVIHLTAECPKHLLRMGLHLHGEIAEAASAAEADEAALAEYGQELDRLFLPLDEIPEVLPVCPLCDKPLNGEPHVHSECAAHENYLSQMEVPFRDTDPAAVAKALAEPFKPEQLGWMPAAVTKDKTRAMAVPHLDARDVMNRLDRVVGVTNWRDEYEVLAAGGVVCKLSVRIAGEWVTKSDAGGQSDQDDKGDQLKAGFSDALKRAAVKWGIGRYLYYVPKQWVPYDQGTRQMDLSQLPPLPAWARPSPPAGDKAAAVVTE